MGSRYEHEAKALDAPSAAPAHRGPRPSRRSLSRRGLLLGGGLAGVAAVGLGASRANIGFPFGDGQPAPAAAVLGCDAGDVSATERALSISNWPAYIDPRKKPGSTMNLYQQSTGVDVDYNIDVYDNNEYYDLVRERLETCRPIDRDLMMLTDWMASRMVWSGWVQEIDAARVPNLHANLIPALRNAAWDPTLSYHAPWQTGLTGIAYNAALVPEVGSFTELLTRADLKGNVTLLSEMNDTMGFMLKMNGADPEDFTTQEWGVAMEQLRGVTASGHVREFTGNEYKKALVRGEILACEAWSGDVIQAQFYNPNIRFVVPEEGLAVWSDNMLIPNGATHKANAELWINHFYDPAVAAKLASWVNYICPVEGAREEMEKIDPSLVDNPLIFPDEKMLEGAFAFQSLDDRLQLAYGGDWAELTSA